ncbi:hypothetical protein BJ912DRAFT_932903 [Pholiota molesta]|nr:hypothetical protein BJ912DRAFT_932903 [Pholiota molesta]
MMETKSVEMTTRIEDALGFEAHGPTGSGNGPRGDAISGWHIKAFMITSRALFGDDLWQIKETRCTSKKPFLVDDACRLVMAHTRGNGSRTFVNLVRRALILLPTI